MEMTLSSYAIKFYVKGKIQFHITPKIILSAVTHKAQSYFATGELEKYDRRVKLVSGSLKRG